MEEKSKPRSKRKSGTALKKLLKSTKSKGQEKIAQNNAMPQNQSYVQKHKNVVTRERSKTQLNVKDKRSLTRRLSYGSLRTEEVEIVPEKLEKDKKGKSVSLSTSNSSPSRISRITSVSQNNIEEELPDEKSEKARTPEKYRKKKQILDIELPIIYTENEPPIPETEDSSARKLRSMSSGNVSSRIVRMNATQEQNFSTKKRTSGGNRKETFILLPGSNPFDRIPPSPDLRRFYYERNGFRVATAETRGSRETMEDAMLVFSPFGCHPDIHLFGVLDGHNGIGARDFLVDNFPKTFSSLLSKHSPSEALSQSFCETNTKLKEVQVPGGCTALFVLFDNNPKEQTQQIPPRPTNGETGLVNLNTADVYSSREKQKQTTFGETERKNYFQTMAGEKNNYFSNGCNVYQHDEHQADLNHTITIANAGDSRAISCIKNKVRVITKDHRPGDFSEMKRITCQGGAITTKYKQGKAITRIDTGAGFLGVSRCFGDFEVGPIIEPVPDLFKLPPLVEDELLILACDGLFDVLENEEVAQITFDLLQIDKSPGNIERACARLCDVAYHRKGKDNISVMIIQHSDTHTQTSSK